MVILGLTGSIATGKTTVANMFKDYSVKIFNDDNVVAKILNSKNFVKHFTYYFPEVIANNIINKNTLKNIVLNNTKKLKLLESIVHPLVNKKRKIFVLKNKLLNNKAVLMFDCPLLFEAGIDKQCNFTIVTYCSEKTQKERALKRGNFTEEQLNKICNNQMPTKEKLTKADFCINTECTLEETKKIVLEILNKIKNNNETK